MEKAVNQLQELGIGMIRMDILWPDVQTSPSKWDFSRYDEIIGLLTERNIQVLGVLQYNKDHEKWSQPPDSFEEFAAYVHHTVKHFKNLIHYWEIWNEPNHPNYWAGPKDGLKTYIRLLSVSYKAAKGADPSCAVLNGGLSEPLIEDTQNLYQNGGHPYFDILNIHPFINPLSQNPTSKFKNLITHIFQIMDRHGDQKKPVWITEMGCPGIPDKKAPQTWFAGKSTDESEQAEWIRTQFEFLKEYPRIKKMFWAFYRDTDKEFNDGADYMGIVKLDLNPKPAFEALKRLIAAHRSG